MNATDSKVVEKEFVIVNLDEKFLRIDEEVLWSITGIAMENHRGIQFANGTMVFKDNDAMVVMEITPEETLRYKIDGMGALANGITIFTVDPRTLNDERESAFRFVIGFILSREKKSEQNPKAAQ
jgi:hypothetical protein